MSQFAPSSPAPLPAAASAGTRAADGEGRLGDLLATPARPAGAPVRPRDVGGRAAWQVLVRDGALEVVRGDLAVPTGTPVAPALRASLLAAEAPTGAVLAGRSAAWVHAGRPAAGPTGPPLDVTYPAGGHRPELWGAGLVWQSPLLRDDTVRLGGARVTTPLRTAVDVALHVPGDQAAASLVRVVVDVCGLDLDDAATLLERRVRAVGRPRARRVLDRARALPSEHAGDPPGDLPGHGARVPWCGPGPAALG
ncbi:hypothetical protein M1843_07090 [Isoptericola sp. 4D.3]|uniref:Transcriptional regulator with AbiEi antitoxin domain of type IV toxin-antitoxin system n=1 Tax=Isoptericola peretonis TaxID=2918523 RepID=A0ABT0J1Y2_9MICO|nr:hypothetical protein [Isoptericola sp. 4D.3]